MAVFVDETKQNFCELSNKYNTFFLLYGILKEIIFCLHQTRKKEIGCCYGYNQQHKQCLGDYGICQAVHWSDRYFGYSDCGIHHL